MDLRCKKCGNELPSPYWFKAPGICVECFPKLTPAELGTIEPEPKLPPDPKLPFPSFLQAVVLLPALFIGLSTPVVFLIKSAGSSIPEGLRFLLLYVGSWGLFAVVVVGIAAGRGRFEEPLLRKDFPSMGVFVQFLAIALVSVFASGGLARILLRISSGSIQTAPSDFFGAFTRIVLAPAAEEILFRGIILYSFLRRMTTWKAIVSSSFLFAVLHVSPPRILIALPTGVLLGWIFSHYRSVGPTIAVHAFVNALGFVISVITLSTPQTQLMSSSAIEAVVIAIASVAAFAGLGFWVSYLDPRISASRTAPA